nr:FecR domain-containing protein [uncultured Desulfobacter sp.]
MSSNRNNEISDRIMEQAALWFARSRAEDFTKEQQTGLDEWLKADPDHRAAFDETQAAWNDIGHLTAPSSASSMSVPVRRPVLFRMPRFGMAGLALMAGLFFCAFYFKSDLITWRNLHTGKEISYKTEKGLKRKITLPDGSHVETNGNTFFTVRFNPWQRNVTLTAGEMFFDVRHDADRPFEIRAHNGLIRVLGTRFHVRNRGGLVSVDVEAGRVRVCSGLAGSSDLSRDERIITDGQGLDYCWAGPAGSIRQAELDRVSAWRQGKIVFRSMRLDAVLKELKHHYGVRIIIVDKKIGEKPFTGTFNTHDLDEILEAITISFSLTAERTSSGAVMLWPET